MPEAKPPRPSASNHSAVSSGAPSAAGAPDPATMSGAGPGLLDSVPDRRLLMQTQGGLDERDMGEGLREVPDLAVGPHVEFLAEQAKVVAQGEQPLKEAARLRQPA